jgi:hypothetical protein
MTNYRVSNALTLTNGQSGTLANAWGIMVASGAAAAGTLTLEGGNPTLRGTYATMSIAHIAPGQPFPCYVRNVSVSSGTVYILA